MPYRHFVVRLSINREYILFAELALDPSVLIILCAVAFSAGFIDAIAGGGGLLTVPALLTAGLPPHMVLGTNKLAATFGSFTASLTYYRKQLFNPRFWRYSLIFTAIGAVLGTVVVDMISKDTLEKVLPLLIAKHYYNHHKDSLDYPPNRTIHLIVDEAHERIIVLACQSIAERMATFMAGGFKAVCLDRIAERNARDAHG